MLSNMCNLFVKIIIKIFNFGFSAPLSFDKVILFNFEHHRDVLAYFMSCE